MKKLNEEELYKKSRKVFRKNIGLIVGVIIFMIPITIIFLSTYTGWGSGGDYSYTRIDMMKDIFDRWLDIAGEIIYIYTDYFIILILLLFVFLARYFWKKVGNE